MRAIVLSLVLALAVPSISLAQDIIVSHDGTAGTPGTDGTDGPGGSTGSYGNPGTPGSDGTAAPNDAQDGGNATAADVHVTAPVTGDVIVTANGGQGGAGGVGGDGGDAGEGGVGYGVDNGGPGAKGGDGGAGGNGATGGDASSVSLAISAAVSGSITAEAVGGSPGEGGNGGTGGAGGRGGAGHHSGNGGDGGNGHVGGDGGNPGAPTFCYFYFPCSSGVSGLGGNGELTPGTGRNGPGATLPAGTYRGDEGLAGADGTISVTIAAAIGGGVDAKAGSGTIQITLKTGASVVDSITANAGATSTLTFDLDVDSESDFDQAVAFLNDPDNAMGGTVIIDGREFTWSNFDTLAQTLRLKAKLTSTISIVVNGTVAEEADTSEPPVYVACTTRTVRAFIKNGKLIFVARSTADTGSFFIGSVENGRFASQNSSGWSVEASADGTGFEVLGPDGEPVTTCGA